MCWTRDEGGSSQGQVGGVKGTHRHPGRRTGNQSGSSAPTVSKGSCVVDQVVVERSAKDRK